MEPRDIDDGLRQLSPGRFTRVSVQTPAGEIEARLSQMGNWELRVRREEEASWRLACSGDLQSGAMTNEPVAPEFGEQTKLLGALEIDPAARQARVGGTEVMLSKKQFALLLILASRPNRVFSKSELTHAVWGQPHVVCKRTLDSHLSKLRTKLKAAGAGSMVINCWGVGYRLWDRTDLTSFPPLGPVGEAA